ncbi:DUF3421 domain containing protein, partial [Asbolus verrucosus]
HYWRDYNGVIPEDALPGGQNRDGDNIYIGQVYVHGLGLCIAPILPTKGTREFYCRGDTFQLTDAVKILCTKHSANFVWLPTSDLTFAEDTLNKNLVLGGRDGLATIHFDYYIGRIVFDGVVQIGIVDTFGEDMVYLYVVHNGVQYTDIKSFEVLVNERVNKE